jgi:hypothetical protein
MGEVSNTADKTQSVPGLLILRFCICPYSTTSLPQNGVVGNFVQLGWLGRLTLPKTQTLPIHTTRHSYFDKPRVIRGEGTGEPSNLDSLAVSGNRV